MPLHLLGKKSWNVYNQANIERVQRDEAEAAAREAAEDERQQENDAARRLAILRGETPPSLLTEDVARDDETATPSHSKSSGRSHQSRSKRKRHGEDDTDFEMRIARERVGPHRGDQREDDGRHAREVPHEHAERSDAPIIDHAGHIDLFPEERSRALKEDEKRIRQDNRKNTEAERDSARQKRDLEDQYMMRFSNAAGRDVSGDLVKGHGPWYANRDRHDEQNASVEAPRKDAFGREDPSRKSRDDQRIEANDPLAMMKRGAAKVRQVEQQRRTFNEEREKELRDLRRDERKKEKRRRRHDESRSHRQHKDDRKGNGHSRHQKSEGGRSGSHHGLTTDHDGRRRERSSPRRHSEHDSRCSSSTSKVRSNRTHP